MAKNKTQQTKSQPEFYQKTIIQMFPNLSRAIEVAKTGNFSLSVHFDKDYVEGFDDYKLIKEFYSGFFDNFVIDGDIKFEISKPHYLNLSRFQSETLVDVEERIQRSLQQDLPEDKLDDMTEAMLKTATERLNLSLRQMLLARKIGCVIAQMDLSSNVLAQHIAEGIMYLKSNLEINAEDNSVKFGQMINIKKGYISDAEIDNTVEYLLKLKNL